jgi:hypothetical protein
VRPPGPGRLKWLGTASIPLKLRGILRPHEPKPFGPILKHLQPFRGHAGDRADRISRRPITHAASDRAGSERSRSAARSQGIIHADRFYRESAGSLSCQILDGFASVKVIAPPLGLFAKYRSPSCTAPFHATSTACFGGTVSIHVLREMSSMY